MDIRNQIVGGSVWVFENDMGMSAEQVSERKGGGWSVWSHSLATETHPPRLWPPVSVGGSLDASSSSPHSSPHSPTDSGHTNTCTGDLTGD